MRRQSRRIVSTLAVTFFLAAICLIFRSPVERVFGIVGQPFVVAGTWLRSRAEGIFNAALVSPERIAELEAERNALIFDHRELENLRQENKELIEQSGFIKRRGFQSVTASIVSRSIGPNSVLCLIDQGTEQGIIVGAPAISGEGILVGKVIETRPESSVIQILTDHDAATAVSVLNETRTIGIAKGASSSLLVVSYIPQDETISINEIVVTSGLESTVPSGLAVGMVTQVNKDPTAPFQEAVLEPLVDIRNLTIVSILILEDNL